MNADKGANGSVPEPTTSPTMKVLSAFICVHLRLHSLFFASLLAACTLANAQLRPSKQYMVAAAHPLAVDAGVKMLQAGGSAIDAMIATQLVLNLVEPRSSGIGGG